MPITLPTRRPGLEFQTFDEPTNALRWFRLEPWQFSPCKWRLNKDQMFTATGYMQLHTAGVVRGSEQDGPRLREYDVLQGDYVVRGQDDSLAVLRPWQFKNLCRKVLASYDKELEGEGDDDA